MNLVERAKNILLAPQTEWTVIERESTTVQELIVSYALPLLVLPAIGSILAGFVVSASLNAAGVQLNPLASIVGAVLSYALGVLAILVAASILKALAPNFGSVPDLTQAAKLVVFSATPSWLAGIFAIIPVLGSLIILAAAIYGIYLFWIGMPIVLKTPTEKRLGYIVIYILITLVFSVGLAALIGLVLGGIFAVTS